MLEVPVVLAFTKTLVLQVAVPPGPVKVPANVTSPAAESKMLSCPEGPTVPTREMEPPSASVLDHLSVMLPPVVTEVGVALIVQVGAVGPVC